MILCRNLLLNSMPVKSLVNKFSFIVIACLFSSGCGLIGAVPGMGRVVGDEGVFRDRQGDYLEAESIPRLDIPNNLDGFVIDDLLVIPDLASVDGQAFLQVPRPRPLQGNPDRAVVIQRMAERSWVIVDARASQVWPRIRQYWLEQGIDLAAEIPGQGMLDTIWFTTDENPDFKEKLRVMVRPGFQDESAEISVLHVSAPIQAEVPEEVEWTDQPEDTEYAYQVLADISTYLADQIRLYQSSTVSFLAGNIPDEGRASMQGEGADMLLHLDADYDRSWAAVGRALERAEIEIKSEEMDSGYFDVTFANQKNDEEQGVFSRFFGQEQVSFPFRINLRQVESGIEVIAESNPDGSAGAGSLTEEQQQELSNALLQTIRNFIS